MAPLGTPPGAARRARQRRVLPLGKLSEAVFRVDMGEREFLELLEAGGLRIV